MSDNLEYQIYQRIQANYQSATQFISFQNGTLEGYKSSNNEIKGVNWAQSKTAVTLGIWIWSKPFMIRRPTGEQVGMKFY